MKIHLALQMEVEGCNVQGLYAYMNRLDVAEGTTVGEVVDALHRYGMTGLSQYRLAAPLTYELGTIHVWPLERHEPIEEGGWYRPEFPESGEVPEAFADFLRGDEGPFS